MSKTYSTDRRAALKIFGAIGATCAYGFSSDELYGQTAVADSHAAAAAATVGQPAALHFFNDGDFRLVSRVAELIIPRTDTPGAIDAGVPEYIDRVVSRNTDHQYTMADGLRWLDGEAKARGGQSFLDLSENDQLAILLPLCETFDNAGPHTPMGRNVQFFSLMKNLTADGYYTSQIGLMEELRYRGNAPHSQFPHCEMPTAEK